MIRIPLSERVRGGDQYLQGRQHTWLIQPGRSTQIQVTPQWSLQIPARAFVDENSRRLEKPVQLSFVVLDSLAAMVKNGHSTQHVMGLVDCRAQCYLEVRRGKRLLQLRKPLTVSWEPDSPLSGNKLLQLLKAATKSLRPLDQQAPLIWESTRQLRPKTQGVGKKTGLVFQLNATGWWALGELYVCPQNSRLFSVRLQPQGEDLSNWRAVLLYDQMNAFIELHRSGRGFSAFNVPTERGAELVVYGLKNRTWWMANKSMPLPWPNRVEVVTRPISSLPERRKFADLL